MKIRQFLATMCAVSLLGSRVQAAPPTTVNEAISQIQADSVLLSGWLSDQFKHAAPSNSTAGNVVPTQLKLFGFEFGAEAVVSSSKVDNDALHALPTSIVDTHQIDSSDKLPFPMILGHAKIGLPWGMDAGVRIGGIPSTDRDDGDTHEEVSNSVFGIDVRKALVEEGMAKPFGLTLGLNYTHAKGHVSATTPYHADAGSGVTFDNAVGAARSDWKTDSVGAQVVMNKKIAFINPYIGTSANKNYGDVDSSISNSGTITSVNGTPTSQAYSTVGTGHATVNEWDLRGLAGIEFTFLPFMKLGLGAEFGSQSKLAGNIGLRVQFH